MEPRLAVIELVVSDMAATLAFYRRLGLDIPPGADGEPHVDVSVGGLRLAFDTERRFVPSTRGGPPLRATGIGLRSPSTAARPATSTVPGRS